MSSIASLSVELVENVLLHLSMQELFLVQRVCKKWQEVITGSPQIQRKMFLGFVPSGGISSTELSQFVHSNFHSIKSARVSRESQESKNSVPEKRGTTTIQVRGSKAVDRIVRFNPIFPSEGGVMRTRTKQFREPLESSSSWLDMYLTQPLCDYAEAIIYYKPRTPTSFLGWLERRSDTAVCVARVRRPEGVRARDVLEEARKLKIGDMRKWQRIDIRFPGVVRA